MSQILGNRVCLVPLDLALQKTDSGVLVPAASKRFNPFFEVVGIGPGTWIKRKGKKPKFIKPDVNLHDRVISTHWQNDRTEWGWHSTQYDERQSQEGWVVADARHILAIIEPI